MFQKSSTLALFVYQRGDYYWVRGVVHGRPVRRSLDTRNRDLAHQRAAKLELGMDDGLQPLTWAELEGHFLPAYSGLTQTRYRQLLHAVAGELARRQFLHEVTSLDLESFLRRGKPRSPNTIRYEIGRLRTIWGWALRHQAVRANAAGALAMPTAVPAETQPLSDAELRALEDAINAVASGPPRHGRTAAEFRDRLWAMYQVLRCTGIRVSDLVKLQPAQVASGYLDIRRTQKTKVPVRLPLLPPVTEALRAVPVFPSGYYFWEHGAYKGACDHVWRTFSRVAARAGLAGIHPHRLRDTFAVQLLKNGGDIRLVSKLLGHSSIRTTEKHYAPWVAAFQLQAEAMMRNAEHAYQKGAKPKRARPPAPPSGRSGGKRPTKKAAR